MHFLDYVVIGLILLLLLVISLRCSARAGRSTKEFILAGRRMPWWLAGISIAVTQLNANNILQDTRKAREDGISGMWFSWNQIIGQAIGTAWFNRLWRRAGFTTQMEFYLARYTGWQAHFTRLFDSVMFGGVASLLWGAMGLIGMKKVLHVLFVIPSSIHFMGFSLPPDWLIITGLVSLSLTFTILAGVHGVVWTDLAEFTIAIFATYFLLFLVLHQVGWGEGLRSGLAGLGPATRHSLDFLPAWGLVLVYYLLISPFINQGGWSPSIQRFLCVKDEREVVYTSISNSILTFAVRGVPFIIIGLCAWILVPDAEILAKFPPLPRPDGSFMPDRERIYPLLAMRFLPTGMLGMAVGAFLCAFIVALSTNIHNSTAVFVNDCYRAYVSPKREDHHYVTVARIYIVFATLITILFGVSVNNILQTNMMIINLVVGAGFVKLLRFVWWRVNGSAEVAAQIASLLGVTLFLTPPGKRLQVFLAHSAGLSGNDGFYISSQLALVSFSTLSALVVMCLTRPEPKAHLSAFHELVRPFGFWGPVRSSEASEPDPIGLQVGLTFAIMTINLGVLGAMLLFFLGFTTYAAAAAVAAAASWMWIRYLVNRLYPGELPNLLDDPLHDEIAMPKL